VHEYVTLEHVNVGSNSSIYPFSIIKNATIGNDVQVGPFAHIRDNAHIADRATVGNFVEIKNSSVGESTSAKHLAYIGDATVGAQVNIGAGTITCNFDGKQKHKTVIEDHAFIGSNNTLIAPVTIGEHAFTAAGSTITNNVPPKALAIARAQQINKLEYAEKYSKLKTSHEDATDNTDEFFCATRASNNDINCEYDSR
jgi:bifunctional UDP-N-acetylglucosamine pyrophosphorylase/glucosamine-1-phosphate N-acetyltransferase